MPYNATQLSAYYQSLTGTAPTGADAVLIAASAQQSQNGSQSDVNTLLTVFNSAGVQATFEVAESTYQFFTGSGLSQGGLNFLEGNAGSGNANGLNTAFYAGFNTENRYYNFAINLASAGGQGNANFVSTYGGLTFAQTVATAYEAIVGSSNVGTANANAAIADITSRQAFFTSVANQRAGGVDSGGMTGQNIALKAIVIGYILEEANKADVGTYAKAIDQLEASVAAGNAQFGANILTTYGASGSGFNTGFAALGANANGQTAVALTTGIDAINATTGNVNYLGTVTNQGSTNVNPQTLQAGDQINASGANNTLTITTLGVVGDATGGGVVTGVQTVDIRAATGTAAFNAQGSVSGETAINAFLSQGAVTLNGVSTQTVGIINDGVTTGGSLTANYLAAATSATVNLAGGTTSGETVALTGGGLTTVNVNSNGGLNTLGTNAVAGGAAAVNGITLPNTVTTLNLSATSPLTINGGVADTGLTTLSASGSGAINAGEINSTVLKSVTTTGLTGTGALTAIFTAAPAASATFALGAGSDNLTFGITAARAAATGEAATTVSLANTNINLGGGTNSLTVTGNITGSTITGSQQADVVTVAGGVDATSVINTSGGGDTIQVGTAVGGAANIAAGATINGGGGATFVTNAANFQAITTGAGFTAAERALITGFSTVGISDALANGATYDVNAIGAQNFTTVGVAGAAGNVANLNAASGAVVTFVNNLGGFGGGSLGTSAAPGNDGTLNIALAGASATAASVLNLGFQGQPPTVAAGAAYTPTVVNPSNITTANVQTINVTTSGAAINAWTVGLNLVDAALTSITFSGNQAVTYAPIAAHTALTTINGANDRGNLNIDVTALTSTLNAPVTVTTGSGDDVVTVRDFARVTTGGDLPAGVSAGVRPSSSGFNTVQVATTTSGQTYSSVLDAKTGDHIVFGAETAVTNPAAGGATGFTADTGTVNTTKIVLASTAVFQDYLDAATGAAHNTAGEITAFDFGGNTYLVENGHTGAASAPVTFQNGTDSVVQLVGIHTVGTTSGAGVVVLGS